MMSEAVGHMTRRFRSDIAFVLELRNFSDVADSKHRRIQTTIPSMIPSSEEPLGESSRWIFWNGFSSRVRFQECVQSLAF